ncbi:spore maturation protein SpmB [Clostridiales Family XIII bacterium PM5-7]
MQGAIQENLSVEKTEIDQSFRNIRKAFSLETLVFVGIFAIFFGFIGSKMGAVNMINTMMNTSFDLLTNTVLYIMAIAVIAGAVAGLLSEFGVIAAVNKILSPLMKPLYGLPGAAVVGVVTTYLSDNPAILTLAEDDNFTRYFKKYQLPALTNIGTAFGMGMIITTFMIGMQSDGENFILPTIIGNLGAVIGSVVSARLMILKTKKLFGTEASVEKKGTGQEISLDQRTIREGSIGGRFMEAMLEGGKNGVSMGVAIIPGVLIICTVVMILTNGPGADGEYTGAAYEGIGLLPWIAEKMEFVLTPLFGFSSPEAIAVPITALGAAGAAIGLIPGLVENGLVTGNDIAVFTSMCMCWSGYLSTHVAMMDGLKFRELTGHAILCHTIGGILAGISAHFIYLLTCPFF